MTVPARSDFLFGWFHVYVRRYMARHFHAVRLSRESDRSGLTEPGPVLVYLNHPSWWDPLTCLIVAQALSPQRKHYAPIDAEALERYGVLKRLGFFPVSRSTAGLRGFVRTAEAILADPRAAIWITPQGRFVDPRDRDAVLAPGAAHVARRVEGIRLIPLALEYPFWHESKPEALARIGEAIAPDPARSVEAWQQLMSERLERYQTALSAEAISQNPQHFVTLLEGTSGVGGIYDVWRRLRAKLTGRPFVADHDP